jgi:hypothetical protein
MASFAVPSLLNSIVSLIALSAFHLPRIFYESLQIRKSSSYCARPTDTRSVRRSSEHSTGHSMLSHPDTPGNSPSFFIGHRAAHHLQGQLDLAVVVALVPDHVLKEEDRVIIV